MESQDVKERAESTFLPGMKRYVLFDQSGSSRRIFFHPCKPVLESSSFHETMALGIAAFENAKAARAMSLPLTPVDLDGSHRLSSTAKNDAAGVRSRSDDADFNFDEDSEELDALLTSDEDDDDDEEVASTITFEGQDCRAPSDEEADSDYLCGSKRKCRHFNDGDEKSISETNLQRKSRRVNEDGERRARKICNNDNADGNGDVEENSEDRWGEYRAGRIKSKVKILNSIVGGECGSKVDLLDETIRLVKSLQHQVLSTMLKT